MQKELQDQVSFLLQETKKYLQQGRRETAYQSSLEATNLAPDEPLTWYLRAQAAPSHEEKLMCLSRSFALDTRRPEAKAELRGAVQDLLKKEPFLAYVYETQELYQVRSGRDLLVNIPKDRAFETPYLQRRPGPTQPVFKWFYASLIGLILGGVAAVFLAPIAVFQGLRLLTTPLLPGDRFRLWIILVLSGFIWIIAIPISWLFLIRLFPA
jgi:hypothetical protein